MSTIKEQMLRLYRDYQRETGKETINTREMFYWANKTGRWKPQESTVRRQFLEQLSNALRQEYFEDNQGRRVRAKHAVVKEHGVKQFSLWSDLRNAPEDFMKLSFSQRRKQISSDCRQLKTDVDSFNENRNPKEPYQLVLDFANDVAEMEIANIIQKSSRRQKTSSSELKRPSEQSRDVVQPSTF